MRHVYNPLLDTILYWIVNLWKGQCHGKCSKGSEKNGDLKLGPWALCQTLSIKRWDEWTSRIRSKRLFVQNLWAPYFRDPKSFGGPLNVIFFKDWGGVLDFEIYPPICFLVMCLFHHVPLFFGSCSGMWGQQSGTCGWWEGTTSYVACPGNAKRHPNDGRRPSAVSRRELLGRSGCSYWSSRPPKKWLVDRCTVSDWMSRVALHIGQIQIHDSTVRMIQNSSNLYKRRIVLRTWAPSQEEEISSTNKFSIDPLLCEEAYVW